MKNEYHKYNDQELCTLVNSGKKNEESLAFSAIYDRYQSMLIAYIRVILENEEQSQDVFQEVFTRLYKAIKSKTDHSNIPGFLVTMARNLCLNIKRNRKNTVPVDEMELAEKPSVSLDDKELLELVMMSLEFLDEKYRSSFMKREFEGLSYSEIAAAEDISVPNAKLRVARAKKMIIGILQPYIKDLSNN